MDEPFEVNRRTWNLDNIASYKSSTRCVILGLSIIFFLGKPIGYAIGTPLIVSGAAGILLRSFVHLYNIISPETESTQMNLEEARVPWTPLSEALEPTEASKRQAILQNKSTPENIEKPNRTPSFPSSTDRRTLNLVS